MAQELTDRILAELDKQPDGTARGDYLARQLMSTYDEVLTAARQLELDSRYIDGYSVIISNQRDDPNEYPQEFYVHLIRD